MPALQASLNQVTLLKLLKVYNKFPIKEFILKPITTGPNNRLKLSNTKIITTQFFRYTNDSKNFNDFKINIMCYFKEVYQRFNNLVLASEKLSDLPSLEAIERRVLFILSSHWSQHEQLTVNESLKKIEEFSNATAFKYIKQLRNKGYIQVVVDKLDNRIKYLSPTNLCDDYFARLGMHIVQAVESVKDKP